LANFEVTKHFMVPKHIILSDEEQTEFLKKYSISKGDLPKIKASDPAISQQKPKIGDIVKIERRSVFGDNIDYYRVVV